MLASSPEELPTPGMPQDTALSPYDPSYGDSPLLSLARQEYLSWHHRRLAAGVAAHWPLRGESSKTIRCCKEEGILPGLQGLHNRFLFGQLGAQGVERLDGFLPFAPTDLEKDTYKELVGAGMPVDAAQTLGLSLSADMGKAATAVAKLHRSLVAASAVVEVVEQGAATSSTPTTPPTSIPLMGTLGLMAPSYGGSGSQQQQQQLYLVFQPLEEAVREHLSPVREAPPHLPQTPLYGPLNLPLYAASHSQDFKFTLSALRNTLQRSNGSGSGSSSGPPSPSPPLPTLTPYTAVLPLNATHFAKLALLYRLTAAGVTDAALLPPPGSPTCLLAATALPTPGSYEEVSPGRQGGGLVRGTFLQRMFCVLARYETFSGNTGGIQGAMPHHVFDALERLCGVREECFASPLNCHFPRFCSAFPDTDACFGSRGSFFSDYDPLLSGGGEGGGGGGAFQANPPFVNPVMLAMAKRLGTLLDSANAGGHALLYFVIVPAWEDAYYFKLLSASPHKVCSGRLVRKDHEYIDGMQHRVSRCTWGANVDSTWFLLCSEAGRWGLGAVGGGEGVARDIHAAFGARTTELGENGRVFKFKV